MQGYICHDQTLGQVLNAYRWVYAARHGFLVANPSSAGMAAESCNDGLTGSARLQMHGRHTAFDGMMMFRVPSRQSLGWGGQHDSPPVYALIHHRKALGPQPVRQIFDMLIMEANMKR